MQMQCIAFISTEQAKCNLISASSLQDECFLRGKIIIELAIYSLLEDDGIQRVCSVYTNIGRLRLSYCTTFGEAK